MLKHVTNRDKDLKQQQKPKGTSDEDWDLYCRRKLSELSNDKSAAAQSRLFKHERPSQAEDERARMFHLYDVVVVRR